MSKDQAWELVQIKGLTAWANSYLDQGNAIADMETDLIDGVKLCLLTEGLKSRVEELARKPIGKWTRKPAHRMQKVENANVAINFLSGQFKVRITTGAEDIVGSQDSNKSNLKMVLGLFWATFRKTMGMQEGVSQSEEHAALLEWVRELTAGYKGVDIKGMKDSWGDGLAFTAMLHKAGVKVDFESLNPADGEKNLAQAFALAEEHFKIPQLLEIPDLLANNPDERTVAFYLNLLKHAMAEYFEKNKIKMGVQALQDELAELRKQLEELQAAKALTEEELARLKAHDEEVTEKLRLEEMLRLEEKSKLEEQMEQLNTLLQGEQEDGRKAEDELKRIKGELEEALRAKSELEEMKRKLEGEGGSMAEQLAEETAARQKLEAELEEMRRKLAAEMERRKNRSQAAVELESENEALKKQALVQSRVRAGLDSLRNSLMEHLEDVYRYREVQFEDEEARDVFDLGKELAALKGLSAEQQLNQLTQKLGNENVNIQRLIHVKDATAELNDLVDKSGWLEMKGASSKSKDFNKHWFVLQGGALMYYRNDNSDRPQGTVKLAESEVKTGSKDGSKEFVISVKAGDKSLSLAAKDKRERNEWRAALGGAVARVKYLAAVKLAGGSRRVDTRVVALCRAAAGTVKDVEVNDLQLHAEEISALAAVLKNHSSISTVSFCNAGLSDSDCKSLGKALAVARVSSLKLAGNPKVTGTGLSCFAELVEANKEDLREVDVSGCAVDDLSALSAAMAAGGKLASLNAANNALKDSAMQSFGKAIVTASALKSLQLANNQLGSGGASLVADAVKAAGHVTAVDLSGNAIGDDGAAALAGAAAANENLSSLVLSNCGLTSAGVATVMKAFAAAEGLNSVTLNGNAFQSGSALAALAEEGVKVGNLAFVRAAAQ